MKDERPIESNETGCMRFSPVCGGSVARSPHSSDDPMGSLFSYLSCNEPARVWLFQYSGPLEKQPVSFRYPTDWSLAMPFSHGASSLTERREQLCFPENEDVLNLWKSLITSSLVNNLSEQYHICLWVVSLGKHVLNCKSVTKNIGFHTVGLLGL